MNVEIKVCCSSFKQELCEEVEHTLRNQFGAHNVKKDNGIFEQYDLQFFYFLHICHH